MKIKNFIQNSPSTLTVLSSLSIQQKSKLNLKNMGLNLNMLQALTLVAIFFEQPEPVTVMKLVRAIGLSKSNVSQIISYLEAEGLVKRTLFKEDQRIWLLNTTKKAEKSLPKIIAYFDSVQKKAESKLEKKDLDSFFKVSAEIF